MGTLSLDTAHKFSLGETLLSTRQPKVEENTNPYLLPFNMCNKFKRAF